MTEKLSPPPPADVENRSPKEHRERPFPERMQRLLAGKPQEERILDPDNPNLIMERKRDL